MDFYEAKDFFKKKYLELGLELIDEHKDELFFKIRNNNFRLSKESIEDYKNYYELIINLENKPVESSICNKNYREQLLSILGPKRYTRLYHKDREFIFGNENSNEMFVKLGPASKLYVYYFLFHQDYFNFSISRGGMARLQKIKETDLLDLYSRPITIKVENINKSTTEEAIELSEKVIETCLFEYTYLNRESFSIETEIPKLNYKKDNIFNFEKSEFTYNSTLPKIYYNSEIIRFYQRGMSTDIPSLQFLSFYHVLEHFFLKVSDEELYQRISCLMNDPKFNKTSSNHLDKLILEIQEYNNIIDEKEMLKMVLKKYVNENDLINFLLDYEKYLGSDIYSKHREVFGETLSGGLIKIDHVYGYTAKLIKTIRNALVHSTDKYERRVRHIPFSESTQIIKKEIPLMKFLAEKVIISSSSISSLKE